jgi:hypothetical protein
MTEILVAFVTGVIGPVLYLFTEKYFQNKRERKRDKLKEHFFDNNVISNELDEIRREFNADRIWIIQFHNGGNFYPSGSSIQKFSLFYESLNAGIGSLSSGFSNIPCSLYSKTFNHLLNSEAGGIMIPDYDNPETNIYGWHNSLEYTGNKSTYLIPLFSFDDKFIGVLGIDYVLAKQRLSKEKWIDVYNHSLKISGFLSKNLKQ